MLFGGVTISVLMKQLLMGALRLPRITSFGLALTLDFLYLQLQLCYERF